MAELRKFQRSKEKVAEILDYLKSTRYQDERVNTSICVLEKSLELIDSKIEEYERKKLLNNQQPFI